MSDLQSPPADDHGLELRYDQPSGEGTHWTVYVYGEPMGYIKTRPGLDEGLAFGAYLYHDKTVYIGEVNTLKEGVDLILWANETYIEDGSQ
jgi:hypothetical protein